MIDVQKASKKSEDSYVAFSIDQADCRGYRASPLSLQVVEIIGAGPDNPTRRLSLMLYPKEEVDLSTGQAPASATSFRASRRPTTVRPGKVLGMKDVSLHLGAWPRKEAPW